MKAKENSVGEKKTGPGGRDDLLLREELVWNIAEGRSNNKIVSGHLNGVAGAFIIHVRPVDIRARLQEIDLGYVVGTVI